MIFKKPNIDSYIKKPSKDIKSFLIYGPNIGLIEESAKNIIKTISKDVFDPFNVSYLEAEDIKKDFGILSSEYNAVSMMGDTRVVIVKNTTDDLSKNISSLFETQSSTLLILTSSTLKNSSSLVKLYNKEDFLAAYACYEDRADDIAKAIKEKLVENGFTINFDALTLLISRLNPDRLASMTEIDKLMMYMGSKKNISAENIIACTSDVSSTTFDDLCYFVASGDNQSAQKSLDTLLKEGENVSEIISSIGYHFYKLLQVASLIEDGFSKKDAISKVVPRLIWLRENSFNAQVSAWSKKKLININELLYNTQKDLRTTNMPAYEIASYLLMQISSAFKK